MLLTGEAGESGEGKLFSSLLRGHEDAKSMTAGLAEDPQGIVEKHQ